MVIKIDPRELGNEIIKASNCKNDTFAVDGNLLVLAPLSGAVKIDLKGLVAALAPPNEWFWLPIYNAALIDLIEGQGFDCEAAHETAYSVTHAVLKALGILNEEAA